MNFDNARKMKNEAKAKATQEKHAKELDDLKIKHKECEDLATSQINQKLLEIKEFIKGDSVFENQSKSKYMFVEYNNCMAAIDKCLKSATVSGLEKRKLYVEAKDSIDALYNLYESRNVDNKDAKPKKMSGMIESVELLDTMLQHINAVKFSHDCVKDMENIVNLMSGSDRLEFYSNFEPEQLNYLDPNKTQDSAKKYIDFFNDMYNSLRGYHNSLSGYNASGVRSDQYLQQSVNACVSKYDNVFKAGLEQKAEFITYLDKTFTKGKSGLADKCLQSIKDLAAKFSDLIKFNSQLSIGNKVGKLKESYESIKPRS